MKSNFEIVQYWVKKDEGGYGNDPDDPGGPTKFGITIGDYRDWTKRPYATSADLEDMPWSTASDIYRIRYWNPCDCDDMPAGIDYFLFDSAMLSGTRTAIKWLQRSLSINPDALIGGQTLSAVKGENPLDILTKMEALRRANLHSQPTWDIYRRGWTNRVNKAKIRAVKLINNKMILPKEAKATV